MVQVVDMPCSERPQRPSVATRQFHQGHQDRLPKRVDRHYPCAGPNTAMIAICHHPTEGVPIRAHRLRCHPEEWRGCMIGAGLPMTQAHLPPPSGAGGIQLLATHQYATPTGAHEVAGGLVAAETPRDQQPLAERLTSPTPYAWGLRYAGTTAGVVRSIRKPANHGAVLLTPSGAELPSLGMERAGPSIESRAPLDGVVHPHQSGGAASACASMRMYPWTIGAHLGDRNALSMPDGRPGRGHPGQDDRWVGRRRWAMDGPAMLTPHAPAGTPSRLDVRQTIRGGMGHWIRPSTFVANWPDSHMPTRQHQFPPPARSAIVVARPPLNEQARHYLGERPATTTRISRRCSRTHLDEGRGIGHDAGHAASAHCRGSRPICALTSASTTWGLTPLPIRAICSVFVPRSL